MSLTSGLHADLQAILQGKNKVELYRQIRVDGDKVSTTWQGDQNKAYSFTTGDIVRVENNGVSWDSYSIENGEATKNFFTWFTRKNRKSEWIWSGQGSVNCFGSGGFTNMDKEYIETYLSEIRECIEKNPDYWDEITPLGKY